MAEEIAKLSNRQALKQFMRLPPQYPATPCRRSASKAQRLALADHRHARDHVVPVVERERKLRCIHDQGRVDGQQASVNQSRQVGKSLLISTVIGGIAAIIAWQALSIWPSLVMYVLLIGLGGLIMGPRIFAGSSMQPAGATWSYGYLTMIVVLAPAVLDSQTGAAAGDAFWSRLGMFIWATIYGTGAVFVFDALWRRESAAESLARNTPDSQS